MTIKIDNKEYEFFEGESILDVATRNGIFIPSLCHHPDLDVKANCRVCVVEIKDRDSLCTSCSTPACAGLEVYTDSPKVKVARDTNLKLIFSAHIEKCIDCTSRFNCELLSLARRYGLNIAEFKDRKGNRETYKFSNAVEIDGSQCIDCKNCITACSDIQKINYLEASGKGSDQEIMATKDEKIDCIYCGQCTLYCPVASAQEQCEFSEVENILKNKEGKKVVAFFAPSVRVSIGEAFGLPYGHNSSGLITASLKKLGFDEVFDVNFGADITTMVEAEEFLERLDDKEAVLPMMTSCCPAWVKYVEFYRPDLIPHLTSSRSPQMHLGSIIKTYWADKLSLKGEDIITVSIMPCTAKKHEANSMIDNMKPVDHVLTIRELSFLIKKNAIDFKNLKEEKTSNIINDGSGAAVIYGASGGVMESALRTVFPGKLEFKNLRGAKGVKEASLKLGDRDLRVAVVSGIGNIASVLDNLDRYHYIEVMACPGGCIGGGGQIIPTSKDIIKKRMAGLYADDKKHDIRKAHENKDVLDVLDHIKSKGLYEKLMHTSYKKDNVQQS